MAPWPCTAAARHLHIVECDARIHRAYPFAGQLQTVCGGGGTDLRPPFAPELLQQHGSAGVVYFTDGMGPWPENAPPQPVLWILLGDHRFGCPFGVQVRMG